MGAAKAGTTSLYNYLNGHPDIYMSPVKEPHYFSGLGTYPGSGISIRTMDDYQALFSGVNGEKAVGEASPSYLSSETAPYNIKKAIPDARIIIVLRNPVERAYSHYNMNLRLGSAVVRPFIKAVEQDYAKAEKGWWVSAMYVELGLYYEQVKRYLDVFSDKNVRVYLYDDLVKDPADMMKDIFHFLGVNPSYTPELGKRFNEGAAPKAWLQRLIHILYLLRITHKVSRMPLPGIKKWLKKIVFNPDKLVMTAEEREYMKGFFREDVKNLSSLIKRDLSFWLDDEAKDRG